MSTRKCDFCELQKETTHYVPERKRFECAECADKDWCQCAEYELDKDGCCNGCGYLEIECMCEPGPPDELCHHGLSLWLCADPINHYPPDRSY